MKISYNWLKQFISFDKSPEELSVILTDIGLEVENLEKVQSIPGGLEGLVIGEVKSCVPHPNADRLKLTSVDVGKETLLSIVCGAPNVASGQKVIVAPVGTTIHPLSGSPFTISKSKIRGEVSEGMLCAEDEIGLGRSHDGILVLPQDVEIGQPVKAHFKLEDDFVFEIGLTPNRADAASHLGVARDLCAYLRTDLVWPERIETFQEGQQVPVSVTLESTACKRYSSVLIEGVEIKESPDWLKERLQAIGVRPINNVVDATNYVLHDLGQPLHAFDADRLQGDQVRVRQALPEEKFVTLDGVERSLSPDDLMICDESRPLCLAGVFGGEIAGVTETTRNVFLESAYFDAVSVRKSSKRHGLKTDASFRFERGTDPEMTIPALKAAAQLIAEVAAGKIASRISDIYPQPLEPQKVSVDLTRVQKLIGKDIPFAEIKEIISSLSMKILSETDQVIEVEVPLYKVDVNREIDVVEEVLRIYGYNNIEISGLIKASLNTSPKPDREVVQHLIADLMVSNGFYEILTNSLTHEDFIEQPETAVKLLNPLSQDLQYMRQTLLYSCLETIAYNQKRKKSNLKLFEFGKHYRMEGESYKEGNALGIALSGLSNAGHWSKKEEPLSFFHLKSVLDQLFRRLGLEDFSMSDTEKPHFSYGLDYTKNGKVIASIGSVSGKILTEVDVNGEVLFGQVDWDALFKVVSKNRIIFKEVSRFPEVRRDLALLVDERVSFQDLERVAIKTDKKFLKQVKVFDVYKGDRLPDGKTSYALSFIIQDEEKTLGDKQIDSVINKLIHKFEKELGAEVRQQ